MDWIKRNLYFTISSVVALLLMGLAGYYLFSKWKENGEVMEKLNQDYAELQRLTQQNPHPGDDRVDNIRVATQQQEQVVQQINKIRAHFQPIPPIPDSTNVNSQEFSAALRRTLDQMQRRATNASITLPTEGSGDSLYGFSFTAQKNRVTFAPGSLPKLSVQLGEVKAICEILLAARINSIDNIRRERVSADDSSGPQTDYHLKKSTTNELAILTPYEITFRSFSQELGAVLAGFASSPHGFLVKTINVEPAGGAAMVEGDPGMMSPIPYFSPATVAQPKGDAEAEMAAQFRSRYGLGGGRGIPGGGRGPGGGEGGSASRGGIQFRPLTPGQGAPPPPVAPTYPSFTQPGVATAAGRGGLPTVLDEKQVKVTLQLDVVKLLPAKKD